MKTEKIGRATIHYKTIQVDGKQVRLHRYLMEKKLNRVLSSNEVVHHINGNKHDNRIENLEVMSRSEHLKEHPEVSKAAKKKAFIEVSLSDILKLKDKGKSAVQIAKELSVSPTKIINTMKKNGINRTKLDRFEILEIRKMLTKGFYQKDIANKFGVSRQLISLIKNGRRYHGI